MKTRIQRILLVGCLAIWQGAVDVPEATAGPVLDWLFQTHTTNYPSMPAAGAAVGSCNTCAPQVCQKTVVNYVPQTHYRTTWARVPVTTYRPVTSSDPCTGCQVTCMKPCTSYTWQARRVPYTTFRPVYSVINVAKPCTTTCNSCPTAAPTVVRSPVTSSGCSGCGNPSYSYTQPSYATPSYTTPSYATPTNQTVQPYYGTPATTAPATVPVNPTPATATPADQAPILDPGGIQSGLQGSNTPSFKLTPNDVKPASRNQTPAFGRPMTAPQENDVVVPVPDPDADQQGIRPIEPAPQLLDPRDKTASSPVRRPWTYSPIKVSRNLDTPPAITAPRINAQPSEQWDSSGWHSVKN